MTDNADTTPRHVGIFERIAIFLLSRLPWFRNHYQGWGKAKRIIIGFLLYLIVLPIIPIVIALVLFIRDPEGFRKSKAFPILAAVIVAWLGAFGYIATRTPTGDSASTTTNASTGTSTTETTGTKSNNTKTGAAGNSTKGRFFENCTAAFDVGVKNIPRGDKSYRPRLDHDNDGIACER